MNAEKLLEAIGLIDDRFVAEAEQPGAIRRRVWVRWTVAAACVALILTAAVPLLLNGFRMGAVSGDKAADMNMNDSAAPESAPQDGTQKESGAVDRQEDATLPALCVIEFADGIYEFAPEAAAAQRAGERLGEAETDWGGTVELFALADGGSRATLAARTQDGTWGYAAYCNATDGRTQSTGELLGLYGAESADSLVRVETLSWDRRTVLSKIENADWLAAFYAAYTGLDGMNNDAWQRAVFGSRPEEEQQALSIEIADSLIVVRIVLANGEQILLNDYPGIGYIYQNGIYFKTTEELDSLLAALT